MTKSVFSTVCLILSLLILAGCWQSQKSTLNESSTNDTFSYQAGSKSTEYLEQKEPEKELPELTSSSTLEDYLEYASLNNAGLEAAFYRWKSAIEQIPQARTLPDPELTFGQYVRQSQMQMSSMVNVMQTFPWFGKLQAQGDAAAAKAKAAQEELESVRLDVYRQVKKEFYEFLYLKEAIDIAGQNLELIRHFEQVALTKYTTASGTHPDIIRAQIELATLDEVLISLKELIPPQTARLNAVLNRSENAELPWPQKPAYDQFTVNADGLSEWAIKKNPRLAQMHWMIEEAKQEVKLAKLRSYPDVGIGVEWTGFDDSGESDGRDSVLLMFRMNLPIWTESYRAGRRQAQANMRAAQREQKQTENQLAADTAQALYDLQETARKINLYEDIIPRTEQLVSTSETAYLSDTVDFLSLIDAQRTLLQYHLNYQRMKTDYQQQLAALEALVGGQIPKAQNESK